uniref:Uncharacterized protein n=1 Tax=Anguilla anguilla TaxID=7936 RepID=A0A0E9SX94_ANGAN
MVLFYRPPSKIKSSPEKHCGRCIINLCFLCEKRR